MQEEKENRPTGQSVYGIVFNAERTEVLLVKRRDIPVWVLPGGGLDPDESEAEGAVREVLEETGLEATTGEFQFACEFIDGTFHAIELFFAVNIKGGHLFKGSDPETGEKQIITDVKYLSIEEISRMTAETRNENSMAEIRNKTFF